jgi:hypothetical protein
LRVAATDAGVRVSTRGELQKRNDRIEGSPVLAKIRADLAYRLPQSGKPLRHIVLDRDQAEQLIDEIFGEPQ